MDITRDREADAIYVTLSDAQITRNEQLDKNLSIDYGADGAVVGVEFLEVSKGVDLTDVPHADAIRALLEGEGIVVRDAADEYRAVTARLDGEG